MGWAPRASLEVSLGVWWYFFVELFAAFAPLYASLWLLLLLWPLMALSFALRRVSPVLSVALIVLAVSVFGPNPSRLPSLLAAGVLVYAAPSFWARVSALLALLAPLIMHVALSLWMH